MTFRIRYHLYRSNPLVFREMLIPSDYSLKQLSEAMCIGLGIDPSPSEMADMEGNLLEGELQIKDLIQTEGTPGKKMNLAVQTNPSAALFEGSLTIFQNEKTRQAAALIIYLEIYFSTDFPESRRYRTQPHRRRYRHPL